MNEEEREHHEDSARDRPDVWDTVHSALPIIACGAAGYVFGGNMGGALGAFAGDVVTGARGIRRLSIETVTLVASAKQVIRRMREQRSEGAMPHASDGQG